MDYILQNVFVKRMINFATIFPDVMPTRINPYFIDRELKQREADCHFV